MFYSKEIGLSLLICHFLASITVGFLFRNYKKDKDKFFRTCQDIKKTKKEITFSNLGEIFSESIINSINLILTIGGFIVLFSVIISILNESKIFDNIARFFSNFGIDKNITEAILSGFLEITNGLKIASQLKLKSLSLNIILSSFLLGFGGISIMMQVYSIISKQKISIKPYIYGKLLQAIFSIMYICLLLKAIPILKYSL